MQVINYFPLEVRKAFEDMDLNFNEIQEIRIRIGQVIKIKCNRKEVDLCNGNKEVVVAGRGIIESIFGAINEYSLYAYADSIRQGYITIRGGHRIGFLGQAVVEEGEIKSINNISSINIRISHQVIGVSDVIMDEVYDKGQVVNTLIISPPGYGKTTLLRDVIRNISNGFKDNIGQNVSVIDERSEIAATYRGMPENDLGDRSDVLDNAPKAVGVPLALRTMAPRVIAVDEIGLKEDIDVIKQAANCGCSILATVHGRNKEELSGHPYVKELINNKCFKRYIVIGERGELHVYS